MEQSTMAKHLIIDANNILYRTFFAQLNEPEDIIIGMCHHSALWSMNKFYREYPVDNVVMAFDSYSWRKAYTKDLSKCITYKKYKGTRRQNLTPKEQAKLDKFDEHIKEFATIMRDQTSILVLQERYLEADDLIAGYIQARPEDEHILISSDKDYMQLLYKNKLTIVDPDSGKPRSLKEWDDDPDFFMFEKCIRGDTSDNVMSSYPYLRSTKLKKAYTDEYELQAVMNHEFEVEYTDDDGILQKQKYLTSEVFDENQYLMNLEHQPEYIRKLISKSIDESIKNKNKFNYVGFLKFCGKYKLKNIFDKIDNFVPMLAGKKIKS